MTTLMYLQAPELSWEDSLLDAKLGEALQIRKTDPQRSNSLLRELAEAQGYAAATSHMELARRYAWGDSLPRDGDKSLEHVMAAVDLDDPAAMIHLAHEYVRGPDPEGLPGAERIVDVNRDAGLNWYRKAAEKHQHWGTWLGLGEFVRNGRRARDCSPEELGEIEASYLKAKQFGALGRMYCQDKQSEDCSPAEIEAAREWYQKGREAGDSWCTEVLEQWGEGRQPDPVKAEIPNFDAGTKAGADKWTTTGILLTPLTLALWAAFGSFLLGLVTSIASVTLPLLVLISLGYGALKAWRSRE